MNFLEKENAFYYQDKQGKTLAKIEFSPSEQFFIISTTLVDKSLSGQGIGQKLVLEVAKKAEREKKKLKATCPFAAHLLKNNAEIKKHLL